MEREIIRINCTEDDNNKNVKYTIKMMFKVCLPIYHKGDPSGFVREVVRNRYERNPSLLARDLATESK